MQVVLLVHLSSSYDQWAHLESSFLLQKKRIHDTICLWVPHAARGPDAHLPCSRVVTGACCALVWPGLWTNSWSWRPCIQVSPPLGQAFLVSWDGCTAAGSSVNTMGAISEILTSHSRAWHRHASCLLIYKNAPGWLACQLANLGVGVSGWYFADRCNLILCCELADAQSGACC